MMIEIKKAVLKDAEAVSLKAVELFKEIMHVTGIAHFHIDPDKTLSTLKYFLNKELYTVFIATDSESCKMIGFIALYESVSLYAEGHFGTIPELYVDPDYRSKGVGEKLIAQAILLGKEKGWTRLEVTTPPLPHFDRALRFYAANGFERTGGYKMKILL